MKTPDAPTGLTITPADKQLTVSWNESPAPVDGYKVYWGTESEKYTNIADAGKAVSYTITGLTNGTTYYVVVKSYADIKEIYYYHTDHIGTPLMMTDKNQQAVWSGEFLPYGEAYSITGSVINNKRFPGQYYDSETGKHDNGFRTYNPPGGTYLQRDPIGFAGGDINLYSYVGNNPVNKIDPEGLYFTAAIPWIEACLANPRACGGAILSGGAAIIMAVKNIANTTEKPGDNPKECKGRKGCLPCSPALGTIGYQIHTHDKRGRHKGMPHVKLFKMNQVPIGTPAPGQECRCFWQYIGSLDNTTTPPPGAVPLTPAAGGGVAHY